MQVLGPSRPNISSTSSSIERDVLSYYCLYHIIVSSSTSSTSSTSSSTSSTDGQLRMLRHIIVRPRFIIAKRRSVVIPCQGTTGAAVAQGPPVLARACPHISLDFVALLAAAAAAAAGIVVVGSSPRALDGGRACRCRSSPRALGSSPRALDGGRAGPRLRQAAAGEGQVLQQREPAQPLRRFVSD